ncbi:acyl-CoA synthetase [Fodinicola acaciae]|uniref:acyl-CoA synthetase n=1 Tax=Fodinicola acaciae TaxID=2681555 RepID=UPI0013CF614F|nr:acyl-CoA synthetase [Fodinicola acaciae]
MAARVPNALHSIDVMRRAGLVELTRPDNGVRSMILTRRWGPIVGAATIGMERTPHALAIVDERGQLTYSQLDRQANSLARGWHDAGLAEKDVIAVLCRDHRWLVLAMLAAGKLGARLLLMNTGFAAPQLADVAERENVSAAVYDQEFAGVIDHLPGGVRRFLAWADDDELAVRVTTLDDLIANSSDKPVPVPPAPGGLVLLTSGTTGTPKGAPRQIRSPFAAAHFLERIPYRTGECTMIAAPLFHGTGFSQFVLNLALGSTIVLRRRFDPEATLQAVEEYRCTALVVVPTMLSRIMDLGPDVLRRYDTSALRIVFAAGSALSPDLGNRVIKSFGPVLYNLYGSTEVAVCTVATPHDWQQAPGTVGRAPHGCEVRLYDTENNQITEPHVTGRIFAGSDLSFSGYTDGGNKAVIDGLLSSGDVGHFDESGLLFVDGRDDDMIVSGGENVYPIEVENLLLDHENVIDAAVIGVPDEDFGQRLRAFVVVTAKVDAEVLRSYVKANLARHKVPREVVFLEELPRNTTGKVLKRKLAEYDA